MRKRQGSAQRMAGASKVGTYATREDTRPRIETMMKFDHMNAADTAAWKKQYGKWRAGHKKRTQERTDMQAEHARRQRRGY